MPAAGCASAFFGSKALCLFWSLAVDRQLVVGTFVSIASQSSYVIFPTGTGPQPASGAEEAALLPGAQDQGRMPDLLDAIDIMHQQEADQVILDRQKHCYDFLLLLLECTMASISSYAMDLMQLLLTSLLGCERNLLHQKSALVHLPC